MSNFLFTSESVSEGHPDKLADQISDAVLDAALALAKNEEEAKFVRSACETLVKGNMLVLAGEMRLPKNAEKPDYFAIVKKVAEEIGYDKPGIGFDINSCVYIENLSKQSTEIAGGVDGDKTAASVKGRKTRAGDQGMMFGYACNETKQLMPLPIIVAHELMQRQAQLRKGGKHDWLRPDAKAQVTVRYIDGRPEEITHVVLSTQHAEEIDGKPYKNLIRERVIADIIKPVFEKYKKIKYNSNSNSDSYHINPAGAFILGGPQSDAGLTGRKIIVDTYGGAAPHGGGAFSGKDPTKVDRSAAYAARHIAKTVVHSKIAEQCQVQISYAIGEYQPVSLMVDTYGTGKSKVNDKDISDKILECFDLSPDGIIDYYNLVKPGKRPTYRKTAAYGHFGRCDLKLPWEQVDEESKFFKWCKKLTKLTP